MLLVRPGGVWLIVCAGNRGRSPYAVAALKAACATAGIPLVLESAGYHEIAGKHMEVHPKIHEFRNAARYDFSAHRSRAVQSLDLSRYARVVCLDRHVVDEVEKLGVPEEKIVLLGAPRGIPDPVEMQDDPDAWLKCGDAIDRALDQLVGEICVESGA